MRVEFPDKVQPIFTPAPYKVIEGGRGKAASWSFARAALILGAKRKLFIVCAREVQKSIKDSVHKLLKDQIDNLGFGSVGPDGKPQTPFYEALDVEIRGANGTTFVFVGLNDINSLKSTEGIDILWVTEAVHVSKAKWTVLLPTVRRDPPFGPFKQGSEIWIDLNPELVTDDTYKMFVVDPPSDAIVIHMSYRDNPFFPEILRKQMIEMKAKDYDEYLTVWEGKTRKSLSGAIFAKEIQEGVLKERIGPHIKYDPKRPVIASFDLGDADMTSMWVWQQIGNEHNAINFAEDSGKDITYFLALLQEWKYIVKGIWLPHDADQAHQSARRLRHNTIKKQCVAVYPSPGVVKVVPRTNMVTRLNATRALFPRININDVVCSGGMMSLQHYRYGVDPHTKQRTKEPMHDWASHGASAFCEYAVWLKEGIRKEREGDVDNVPDIEKDGRVSQMGQSLGWMGS